MDHDDLPRLYRADAHGTDSRETRRLARGAARGELVAVHPGVFASAAEVARLDVEQRHRLRIRAAMPSLGRRLVVSHESAMLHHGLRTLRRAPTRVHVTDPRRTRGQSWRHVVKHPGPLDDDEVEVVDGVRVTTLSRTLIDVALLSSFETAVAAIDSALAAHAVSTTSLEDALAAHHAARGRSAAARAIEFGSPCAGSAGESWARCRFAEFGAPAPELQRPFDDALGEIGIVDFYFAGVGVVVEFDGDQKYVNERYRSGLTASEIVLRERRRERRLLALPEVRAVVRCDWRDVAEGWRLRRLMVDAGLPVGRPPRLSGGF